MVKTPQERAREALVGNRTTIGESEPTADIVDRIAQAIQEAVAEQREKDARIAERHPRRITHTEEATGLSNSGLEIAKAIRREMR